MFVAPPADSFAPPTGGYQGPTDPSNYFNDLAGMNGTEPFDPAKFIASGGPGSPNSPPGMQNLFTSAGSENFFASAGPDNFFSLVGPDNPFGAGTPGSPFGPTVPGGPSGPPVPGDSFGPVNSGNYPGNGFPGGPGDPAGPGPFGPSPMFGPDVNGFGAARAAALPPAGFENPDGSKTVAWQDGMQHTTGPDGSYAISWPDGSSVQATLATDGSRVEAFSDGSQWTQRPDGSSEFVDMRGRVSTRAREGNGNWITTRPDGSMMTEDASGGTTWVEPSGFQVRKFIDPSTGATVTESSDGMRETVRPDGSFERVNPDGTRDVSFLDKSGNIVTQNADGSGGLQAPDGSGYQIDKWGFKATTAVRDDGTRMIVFSDGASQVAAPDGSWTITTNPAGAQTLQKTLPDGSLQVNFPSGGVTRFNPDAKITTFTDPSGGTYKIREQHDGSVLTTDPNGTITAFNPVTKATEISFPDGTKQTTDRLDDGSLRTVLADGSQVVESRDGKLGFFDAGVDVTAQKASDGMQQLSMPDGVDIARSADESGVVTARYDAMAEGGSARPQAVIIDPENGTSRTVLSDGGTVDVLVQPNGAVVLRQPGAPQPVGSTGPAASPDRTVELDPAGGVVIKQNGEPILTSSLGDTGDTTLETAAGRQIVFGAGGGVQQVTDPSGASATATTGQGGVTVVLGPDELARAYDESFSDKSFRLVADDGSMLTTTRSANGDPVVLSQAGDQVGPESIRGIYYPFGSDALAIPPVGSTRPEGTQP